MSTYWTWCESVNLNKHGFDSQMGVSMSDFE